MSQGNHYPETLNTYSQLRPGDRIRVAHAVKVGFRSWESQTEGVVVNCQRQRHGLHRQRNFDDKVFSDQIVLQLDDQSLSTITLDEFSQITLVEAASS